LVQGYKKVNPPPLTKTSPTIAVLWRRLITAWGAPGASCERADSNDTYTPRRCKLGCQSARCSQGHHGCDRAPHQDGLSENVARPSSRDGIRHELAGRAQEGADAQGCLRVAIFGVLHGPGGGGEGGGGGGGGGRPAMCWMYLDPVPFICD